jgi:hypothetical protein
MWQQKLLNLVINGKLEMVEVLSFRKTFGLVIPI